ncbi:tRNA 2'-phosphotransferase 1, variant 3 [Schistosoma haematobium]|uniref:2'-phosphotransferase n=1 Tax=Schistosoma haematobium TaxID=6185 RepID=A0A922LJ13_SCHHA|nr:tRNA 2'-phosphotransferase 1, variant 3 [Schistosoma haematobium]KAH9585846.1 tRNA 2'-phosphotransferase 1, variant 3 [Schistosoma haematobium]
MDSTGTPFQMSTTVDVSKTYKRKSLDRYERIGNLLEQFLKGKLQHIHKFTDLPDGYFLIDEIIQLPEFKKEHCTYDEIIDVVHNDALLRFSVRGSKVRLKPPELNKDPDVILSKKLAWILRHGAENVGMKYEPGGYLYVDKILQLKPFQGVRLEDISRVVNSNDKKRYELSTNPENGRLRIRAYQGHTVTIEGLDISLIENPEDYPTVIHGTYFRNWDSIRREGLKRMQRTHIHFAPGEVGETGVISAINDGYKFYLSKNNVILCEGNKEGCLPTKYFRAAYQRNPRLKLSLTP